MYGTRNSTCSLKLPSNFCLVMTSPLRATTSTAPPGTSFHLAGDLPSLRCTQPSRLLPSKSTTAPLGGGTPATSFLSSGLSNFRSLMSPYWARPAPARARAAASAAAGQRWVRMGKSSGVRAPRGGRPPSLVRPPGGADKRRAPAAPCGRAQLCDNPGVAAGPAPGELLMNEQPPSAAAQAAEVTPAHTVLVVDDSAMDRHLAGSIITKVEGWQATYAADGAEALAALER